MIRQAMNNDVAPTELAKSFLADRSINIPSLTGLAAVNRLSSR